jgi:hypothetical protein
MLMEVCKKWDVKCRHFIFIVKEEWLKWTNYLETSKKENNNEST